MENTTMFIPVQHSSKQVEIIGIGKINYTSQSEYDALVHKARDLGFTVKKVKKVKTKKPNKNGPVLVYKPT